MRRLVLLGAAVLVLAGCGVFMKPPDTVSFPRGQFFVTTFRVGQAYTELKTKIELRCQEKKLDAAFCAEAAKKHQEFERSIVKPLLRALQQSDAVMDWAAVMDGVSLLADMAKLVL